MRRVTPNNLSIGGIGGSIMSYALPIYFKNVPEQVAGGLLLLSIGLIFYAAGEMLVEGGIKRLMSGEWLSFGKSGAEKSRIEIAALKFHVSDVPAQKAYWVYTEMRKIIRQHAVDGEWRLWGRIKLPCQDAADQPLVLIPAEFWKDNDLEMTRFIHCHNKDIKTEGDIGLTAPEYFDLRIEKKAVRTIRRFANSPEVTS